MPLPSGLEFTILFQNTTVKTTIKNKNTCNISPSRSTYYFNQKRGSLETRKVFIKTPQFSFFWVAPGRCGGRIGWDSVAFWGPFWSTFWVHFRVQIWEPFWTLPGWPWGILMVPFGSLFGPKRVEESIQNRGPERGASEVMARG